MNYRKPTFWVIVLALILCAILAVSMLTDPVPEATPADIFAILQPSDVQWAQITVWDQPAGDHIVMDKEQINELVSILNSLEAQDFAEKNGMHGISVMVNCGEQEILMQMADEQVYFSFDSETAEALGNVSWSIRSRELTEFIENIAHSKPDSTVTEWASFATSNMDLDTGLFETTVQAFPGVTFRCTYAQLTAEDQTGEHTLIQGMPIWNVYFTDLTGDVIPEICATVSFGSGMIDTHVVVYDYVNGQEYTLWDRGIFDYSLRLENGVLLCEQYTYPGGFPHNRTGFLSAGALILTDAGGGSEKRLTIDSDEMKSCIVSIVDQAETEQIATASSFECFYEDEQYSYFFPSIRSHLVMVTYYDGSTEDIRTALEMGRATISDLDRFGIHYHTMTKILAMEPTD